MLFGSIRYTGSNSGKIVLRSWVFAIITVRSITSSRYTCFGMLGAVIIDNAVWAASTANVTLSTVNSRHSCSSPVSSSCKCRHFHHWIKDATNNFSPISITCNFEVSLILTGFTGTILHPSFMFNCKIVMTFTSLRYGIWFITPMDFSLSASLFRSLNNLWLTIDSDKIPCSSSSGKQNRNIHTEMEKEDRQTGNKPLLNRVYRE